MPTPHHIEHVSGIARAWYGFWHVWNVVFAPIHMHKSPGNYYGHIVAAVVAGFLILLALANIPGRYRKATIGIATFLGGLYYVLEFFIPVNPGTDANFLTGYQTPVANVSLVIGSFSVGIGIISLIGMHMRALGRGKQGWGFSLTLVASFLVMFFMHLLENYDPHYVLVRAHPGMNATITNDTLYNFLFNGGLVSLDAAMFALIGFFIVSSSYRAFRIRTVESSLLMGSALIVMLGQVSVGVFLTHWLPGHGEWANFRFETMARNILMYINSPAQRAVTFGLALGFLATSLRLWLSLERGLYFD